MGMRVPEWEEYLKNVLSFVKFKYDHNAIYFELIGHMEERYEDLVTDGMEEQAAKEMTVLRMGDAKEVGKGLNEVHNPVLGRAWLLFRRLMQFMLIITAVPLLGMLLGCVLSISALVMPLDIEPVVYEISVDKKIAIDDRWLYIDTIIYHEDGSLRMEYQTFIPPLSKHRSWAWDITIYVEEALDYYGGYGSGHYLSGGYKMLYDVDEDAQELTVTYAYGRELKIDLTEGRVMAK